MFEVVVDLRHRRADIDEQTQESKRAHDANQRVADVTDKKLRWNRVELEHAKKELDEFQFIKMQRVNELPSIVFLPSNQLFFYKNKRLPDDLSPAIVFQVHELERIKERIKVAHTVFCFIIFRLLFYFVLGKFYVTG